MKKITEKNYKKILGSLEVTRSFLDRVQRNVKNNELISGYYNRLAQETKEELFFKKTENVGACNKIYELNRYEKEKIKDIIKTNNCHDKFCNNCKKLKQAARMEKYIPELKKYKKNLYHMTLTQPNVGKDDLEKTISLMAEKFRLLIQFIRGDIKISGVDFDAWGYFGAMRSLEITFGRDPDDASCYHPHYHVALVMEDDFDISQKIHKNAYSFDKRTKKITLFSDIEILMQKVWYLLINGEKVTKSAIEETELGYSCTIKKFKDDDYAELFKYISKTSDESSNAMLYEHFKTLYYALNRKKQIQGYGGLYRVDDNISEADIEKATEIYEDIKKFIDEKEEPVHRFEKIEKVLEETEYLIISKRLILKQLIKIMRE